MNTAERIAAFESARTSLYPDVTYFTPEETAAVAAHAGLDAAPTNAERSEVEVAEWKANPPAKYFVYISETDKTATTWTGDVLGLVDFGREFRDNFGGKRVPITVIGTNGKTYHGTYYKSAGDYARIKMSKR